MKISKILGVVAVLAVFVGFFMLVSCKNATEKYVNSFESFVQRTERNAQNYTDEQWKRADTQFEAFTGERYEKIEHKLTSEQKKKVAELTARYYKLRVKSTGSELIESIKNGLNYIEGFTKGILGNDNGIKPLDD